MTDLHMPPIGGYCMLRDPKMIDARMRTVFKVAAIRGRVSTSAGVLVPPSPTVTVENVKTKERQHMSLVKFHEMFTTVVN